MQEQPRAKTEQLHGENQRWRPTCEQQPADRGGMQQCMEELAWGWACSGYRAKPPTSYWPPDRWRRSERAVSGPLRPELGRPDLPLGRSRARSPPEREGTVRKRPRYWDWMCLGGPSPQTLPQLRRSSEFFAESTLLANGYPSRDSIQPVRSHATPLAWGPISTGLPRQFQSATL